MKQENMPKADFVVSILLMGFGVWVVIHSLQMPRFKELGADPMSVPGIVPGILGTVIFILSLVVFIRSLARRGYRLGLNRQTLKNFFQETSSQRMLLTIFICIGYGIFMVGSMNYYPATFIFVLVFIILFQFRASQDVSARGKMLLFAVLQALLAAGIVGAVFRYLFLVDLP
ncbi:MAG: tripartite tricarboxylate transporter TctB family protein [Desulfobacterales bacterium]|nr:tripartite tricarboxylate transporter TctB family protein [Desulfobacterales bacterium]